MEAITFNLFRELQRKERENEELQSFPANFWDLCQDWFKRKRKDIGRDQYEVLSELRSARSILKDIFGRRERKILLLALHSVRGAEVPKNLLKSERNFYDSAVDLLYKNRRKLREILSSYKKRKEFEEKEIEGKRKGNSSESAKIEREVVKICSAVKRFVGPDLQEYGPLSEGDIIQLPKKVANLLQKKGKAELRDIN